MIILPKNISSSRLEIRVIQNPEPIIQTLKPDGKLWEMKLDKQAVSNLGKLLQKIKKRKDQTRIATREFAYYAGEGAIADVHAILWPEAPNHMSLGHILLHTERGSIKFWIPTEESDWEIFLKAFPS